jgi:hypothetical protein
MRSSKRNLIFIIGGVLLAALVIAVIVIYPQAKERWTAPLGPGLELPTHTPNPE